MSIRSVLVLSMLAIVLLAGTLLGVIEIRSINRNIIREAQSRVDHDLRVLRHHYERRMQLLADRLEAETRGLRLPDGELNRKRLQIKRDLEFTVLNICDVEGNPVSGSHPEQSGLVPVAEDSLLRRSLEGSVVWGTVLLNADRLYLEGGRALQNAMMVRQEWSESQPFLTEGLFWWFAAPLRDENDRVVALLYGGRALNFNYGLVDELRDLITGSETFQGKPVGTVTIFLRGVRAATNVRGPDQTRAVGTPVSDEVQEEVLKLSRPWSDRAWVVDAWYLSGYEPLRDPDGETVGMLYVGLLEAPYAEMKTALVTRFLLAAASIDVQVRCPAGARAEADPELLRIALGNYLSNAAKYGKDGGRAEVLVDTTEGRVTMAVWNEGPGFSENNEDKLFKKFSRIRDATTRGKRGSGLGLSITKEIMDLHSGQVWAESEAGRWARFGLSFPSSGMRSGVPGNER